MKKYFIGFILSFLSAFVWANDSDLQQAYRLQQSHLQVQGQGRVIRILSDDIKGDKHQRFILRLASNQTLLIAHNIDLAPKINNLQIGGLVTFYGEYEWNHQGGMVHWTHRDPSGNHLNGWLKYQGKSYR